MTDGLTLKRQSALVAELERAWTTIAARHPELPAVAIIVGQGSGHRGGGLVLGHFAAERWTDRAAGLDETRTAVHELMIGGEGLKRGAGDVLGTLLHEAAHALASARAIKDTSRQGRYHNKRYKQLAEELGLTVERHPEIGWSLTAMRDDTAATYAATITALDEAISLHRRSEPAGVAGGRGRGNLVAATCACEPARRIRVATGTLAAGPIVCTLCDNPFAPDEQDGH